MAHLSLDEGASSEYLLIKIFELKSYVKYKKVRRQQNASLLIIIYMDK